MSVAQVGGVAIGPTFRAPVVSGSGVVATPHYLASLAGAEALRDGGSAVDAAIAANLVLAVVWPHMCGVGGDLFAQVWSAGDGRLYGLNGSGHSGAAATLATYRERGLARVPQRGPLAVTVPGAVDGWFSLHERWGRLPAERVFRDAIRHAREGFAVSARLSAAIRDNADLLGRASGAMDVFLPTGTAPAPGERLVQAELASTLAGLAREGPHLLYRGALGERIVAFLRAAGSLLGPEDFAAHRSDWVEPLRVDYRGVAIAELPPNTQGIVVLEMLTMLEPCDVAGWGFGTGELLHQVIERKKLAFADRDQYVGDPAQVAVPVRSLLAPAYARERARLVGERAAPGPPPGHVADGDTIYLCAADRDGNVVSLIQSLYNAWGSGVLVPGTGVLLQNRGYSFKLVDGHANALAPRKRPMHTLIPGFALRDGRPWLAFGTRGADGQPQTGVQLVMGLLDFGLDPQAAVEAPRWVHGAPSTRFAPDAVVLETRFDPGVAASLEARGHHVVRTGALDDVMGTAQLIQVDLERGCYVAGSDPRGDGVALAI